MVGCPGCGSKLLFDIKSQRMKCTYCDQLYDVASVTARKKAVEESVMTAEEVGQARPKPESIEEAEMMDVTVYTCTQCGAQITADDDEVMSLCLYCGSEFPLTKRLNRVRVPKKILPFRITEEDCTALYKANINRQIYAPSKLRNLGRYDRFRGVYMPFWAYDIKREGGFSFPGKDVVILGNEEITTTYEVSGGIKSHYDGIVHDASDQFEDAISESICPYDMRDAVSFDSCYMNGFYALAADRNEGAYRGRAVAAENDLICNAAIEKLPNVGLNRDGIIGNLAATKTSEFDGMWISAPPEETEPQMDEEFVYGKQKKSSTAEVQSDLAMLPVWFFSYRWGKRVSYATVNGQTGRIFAEFPASPTRFLLLSFLTAIPVFLLLYMTFAASPPFMLFLGLVGAFTVSQLYKREVGIVYSKRFRLRGESKSKEKKKETSQSKLYAVVYMIVYGGVIFFSALPVIWDAIFTFPVRLLYLGLSGLACVFFLVRFFRMRAAYSALKGIWLNLTNGFFFLISAAVLAIYIMNPPEDYQYYSLAIGIIAVVTLSLVSLIRGYNIVASNQPKQLKKGGKQYEA
ncbi:MAG: hypothetical protein J5531_07175 [Lachnospiraceae bacterium]|nr:hypothetical protein [Lachnospiraceae bacterium]